MTADAQVDGSRKMPPSDFLFDLNETAMYAATRGAPFLLPSHVAFLLTYMREWLILQPGNEKAMIEALLGRTPIWIKYLILRMRRAQWIPESVQRLLLLTPLFIPLVVILPWQAILSSANSGWDVLRKGVRSAPPLITAVVVVFVTGDAWRILGTGFTLRFFVLVSVFLLGSLIFLIRKNCWSDIDANEDEAKSLLQGIKHRQPMKFNEFIRRGVRPAPMERPGGLSAVYIYLGYLALISFSLITVMLIVSSSLIIVGLILINAKGTQNLAGSAYIYQSFPGIVITRQLLSLSFSLGAFAAFFLVAAQHADDREVFVKNILARYRRALLVYTVYCRAHDLAQPWTDVPIKLKLCKQGNAGVSRSEKPCKSPGTKPIV